MKKMTIKTILTLSALALLLTFTVSGTLAYIATQTGEVENVFEPVEVDTEIDETFRNDVKSVVKVKNVGDIPVFVRVAVIGNWCNDANEVVEPWNPSFTPGSGWSKRGEYYYYNSAVQPGDATGDLLGSDITTSANNGLHLEVVVMQQAIQAEPTSAVEGVWGFVPGSN
ncbi:MAG: hypothetical protein IKU73_04290 [Clostridia bacterium]|nr:hypothetical protein [Clostridia bacterium]